jgi:presenilin-like A22 family membrane protease
MKHNLKITAILVIMFFITQLIGLAVIYADPLHLDQVSNGTVQKVDNPYFSGLSSDSSNNPGENFISILVAFIFALIIFFLLAKFKVSIIMRAWFFIVVVIVITITVFAFEKLIPIKISLLPAVIIALLIALVLAVFKVFKRNIIIHNITELLIYPGIAVVFIPLLNIWTIILLLIIISIYDIWAVWHSGIMQKMAKYQINELKIFAGFYVPYLNKKQRAMIKEVRASKNKKLDKKSIKVNLAILGGGDVVFPIITSGIIFSIWGLIPALAVVFCATLALIGLFIFAKKGKFYPAMPFLTAGLFIGILIAWMISMVL